jgi:amino acid transporter
MLDIVFPGEISTHRHQGTGLFLSSGQVIAIAGPAGAFLAYIVMGFVTAGVAYTTGEISAFMPSTGGFIRHATRFVEPALGAATGWNFCMYTDSRCADRD